jgi:hypothetical protein
MTVSELPAKPNIADVVIEIRAHFASEAETAPLEKIEFFTNAKPEYLDEILGNYLQDQMMIGTRGTPIPRLMYTIQIGLFLAADFFVTNSDCGINTLTVGIVSTCYGDEQRRGRRIDVRALADRHSPPTIATDL